MMRGRPAIANHPPRAKITLTISADARDMTDLIRQERGVSISQLTDDMIRREYRRLVKSGRAADAPIPGQLDMFEQEDNI